jgi:hypothetical protein
MEGQYSTKSRMKNSFNQFYPNLKRGIDCRTIAVQMMHLWAIPAHKV